MLIKILLWFFCKIESPIISPSLGNYRCLYCHKKHGIFVGVSPSRMMAEDIGESLQSLQRVDNILKPIRQAIWEAKRDGKTVLKIHVTCDFYMQLKAECNPPVQDIQRDYEYPILGYSVIQHFEPCEKEWWLEIEGDYIPQPANEAWREL